MNRVNRKRGQKRPCCPHPWNNPRASRVWAESGAVEATCLPLRRALPHLTAGLGCAVQLSWCHGNRDG